VTGWLEKYALAGDQTMSVAAKIVHCAAGFQHLKWLMTLRTAGMRRVMCSAGCTDKFTVAERQRLLTFFTKYTHYVSPPCFIQRKKKRAR